MPSNLDAYVNIVFIYPIAYFDKTVEKANNKNQRDFRLSVLRTLLL